MTRWQADRDVDYKTENYFIDTLYGLYKWSVDPVNPTPVDVVFSYSPALTSFGGGNPAVAALEPANKDEFGGLAFGALTQPSQYRYEAESSYATNVITSFISDLRLKLAPDGHDTDVVIYEAAWIKDEEGKVYNGVATPPRDTNPSQAFVMLDSNSQQMQYVPVQFGTGAATTLVMHEFMHSLGFAHPHDEGFGSTETAGEPHDQIPFTIMSYQYIDGYGQNVWGVNSRQERNAGYASTPMAIDIAALQYKYGASTKASGDSTYELAHGSAFHEDLDVTDNTVTIGASWHSIWDTGGHDRIKYSGSNNALINLNEAHLSAEYSGRLEDIASTVWSSMLGRALPTSLLLNITDPAHSAGGFISTTWDSMNIRLGGFTVAHTLRTDSLGRPITADTGIEVAVGGSGDDVLIGNSLDNSLVGGTGRDLLIGGDGDDLLDGGEGADELIGGRDGNPGLGVAGVGDTVTYVHSVLGVEIDLNLATQSGGDAEGDILNGIENVVGSGQRDLIVGDAGDNTLEGRGGDDTLQGGGGTNYLLGGTGRDTAIMGNGIDTVVEVEVVDYSQGQTRVVLQFVDWYPRWEGSEGDARGDRIYGGGITFKLTDGDDYYSGAPYRPESIFLSGINGDEVIHAGAGNDEIHVRSGSNLAHGGAGNDTIRSDGGRQEFYGEADNDVLLGSTGQDLLYGGAGFDWIDPGYDNLPDMVDFGADGGGLTFEGADWGWNSPVGVTVDMAARSWSDRPTNGSPSLGYGLNDVLVGDWSAVRGTSVADHIRGDGAANLLEGRGGNDTIYGGGGNDRIFVNGGSAFGEGDDDALFAGYETDLLDGGSGNDTIHGSTTARSGSMDTFRGGSGVDYMYGGAGQTTFVSADDGDRMYGTGADVVSFADSDHAVTLVGLATSAGTTMEGVYRIFGSTKDDTVTAAPAVYVHGGGGADTFKASAAGGAYGLFGDGGDDVFEFAGSDKPLYAEGGADRDTFHFGRAGGQVYGGSGDDLFVIDPAGGSTSTMWIEDFTRGAGSEDRIKVLGGHSMSDVSVYYDWYYNRTEINVAGFRLNLRGYETLHADDFLFA